METPPTSLDEIRDRVSFKRWRVYEAVREQLAEIESHVDWEKLYEVTAGLEELVGWGLYLEETLPAIGPRLAATLADGEPPGARAEPRTEELEDHVHWGTRQIEGGIRQSLAVLSREMVELITAKTELTGDGRVLKQRALGMPLAEVAGKLRSDLRKLTAFLVADDCWHPDDLELLLFPEKRGELERGRLLKERLVDAMEGFQGSDERLPVSDVLRMWRNGQALGQAALAEIDTLVGGLLSMLGRDGREALYLDSYYRLLDWIWHLERCSEGLQQHLGDEAVEDQLTKEIAAILDVDILAEILGDEYLPELAAENAVELAARLGTRELKKLEMPRARQARIVELCSYVRTLQERGAPVNLDDDDVEILRWAAAQVQGQQTVERLRLTSELPDTLSHLAHVHPLVQASEDGLKTYLTLLYGQIQNRDLHLLEEDEGEVSLAEKRLAVAEFEHRLASFESSEGYFAFEAVRHRLRDRQEVPAEEWEGLQRLLDQLDHGLVPRLDRLASFTEVAGAPADGAIRLREACAKLAAEEPPGEDQVVQAQGWSETLANLLTELRDLTIVLAPPETEAEIEDFLNMMG